MASVAFGESVDLLGSIRSILENYPFSAGLLRELLQNSDDAKATRQIFLLDCRSHQAERLWNAELKDTQGPALLAYNNATFTEDDWVALRNISKSSKREDTSKIGKFGIGIRSCYHITDFLEVLSGKDLVIFDPRRCFSSDGGVRITLKPEDVDQIRDHISAFSHFLPDGWNGEYFEGTIVRLPLRTQPSDIREKTVSAGEIRNLFQDFIDGEINMSMLFLQHLRSIDFIILHEGGREEHLATCTVRNNRSVSDGVIERIVNVQASDSTPKEEHWLVSDQGPPADEALELLKKRVGSSCDIALKNHKLRPDVGIAYPLPHTPASPRAIDIGRLFTFLRLPIETGFPVHVHACFALTPSRQNLRNRNDNGVVRGSEAHVLAEWNKMLFEVFIPRAWASLLAILSTDFPKTVDLFSTWPPSQSHVTAGESAYWQALPRDVFDAVLEQDRPVWPVINGGCYRLDEVFVASALTDASVLRNLSNAGMKICGPVPSHIFKMISEHPTARERVLNPRRAGDALRRTFATTDSTQVDFNVLLVYLLSSNDVSNIVSLPIVPTTSGRYTALSPLGSASPHVLLESDESELFSACDDNAIPLDSLPDSCGTLLRCHGPTSLNLQLLSVGRVVEYLRQHPILANATTHSAPGSGAVSFLSKFWTWRYGWKGRSSQLPRELEGLHLVPCAHGMEPVNASRPAFEARSIANRPALVQYLSSINLPLVVDTLDPSALEVLSTYGLLRSPSDIPALLDCIHRRGLAVSPPSDEQQTFDLLCHFNDHIVRWHPSTYSEAQKTIFKRFPIFPLVEHTDDGAQIKLTRRSSSVDGLTVYGIESFDLLPRLPNTVFIDFKSTSPSLSRQLLQFLNPSTPRTLTDNDILSISVNRFGQQSKRHLAHILLYVASKGSTINSTVRSALRDKTFVQSADGSLQPPRNLIDARTPLHPLFVHSKDRLPRDEDVLDKSIVASLSALDLMDSALSSDNVINRIEDIASNMHGYGFQLSVALLNILYAHSFSCVWLAPDKVLNLAWLPTQKGTLSNASGCRPARGQSTNDNEWLFDQVLEKVHSSVHWIPPTLKTKLGWDEPISRPVLLRQLSLVLEFPQGATDLVPRIVALIKELSSWEWGPADEADLWRVVNGKEWVPVVGSFGAKLACPWQAVLSSPFDGVHQVYPDLVASSAGFLQRFGCPKAPTFNTVIQQLSLLSQKSPSVDVSRLAIKALAYSVNVLNLDDEQRGRLLVPDTENRLRPYNEIIFNDVAARSVLVTLGPNDFLASKLIDEPLANALKLQRLGLKFSHLNTLGEDMGVTPATIVKKTLEQYTEKQFLPEFLANAEDAGAERFEIILNPYHSSESGFLSPALKTLCTGPSVMICNDKEFSEDDFTGICRTHVGSKGDAADTIGQFGLGALTMFHITECAMIYSGSTVLFLDPAKSWLPATIGRASLAMPLENLLKMYPGHTNVLKGNSYYDEVAKRVNGTIFFLPLRSPSLSEKSSLRTQAYTIDSFQQSILRDFEAKAPECLLFISINHITAYKRGRGVEKHALWSLQAQRKPEDREGCAHSHITITYQSPFSTPRQSQTNWRTISKKVVASSIPTGSNVRVGRSEKCVRLGLAAALDKGHQPKSKFFSTLPLAIPVALPVHVNASFRLSSDRRQIRLDGSPDGEESQFNRYLLSQWIPTMYLMLLEVLAKDQDNAPWWPGARYSTDHDDDDEMVTTSAEDSLTMTISDNFYTNHLPKSTRKVFKSTFTGAQLSWADAVLFPSRSLPRVVREVLNIAGDPSLVKLPSNIRARLTKAGARMADETFLKSLFAENRVLEGVRAKLVPVDLADLLLYLSGRDRDPALLRGLPLLLTQGGTWLQISTGQTTCYHTQDASQLTKNDLFPVHRFVHPDAVPSVLVSPSRRRTSNLNVAPLDGEGLKRLIEERLRTLTTDAKHEWIDRFWRALPQFPPLDGLWKTLEDLPLVPTADGVLKSLVQIKDGESLLTTSLEESWLKQSLQELGISIVDPQGFPSELRSKVRYDYSPRETILAGFLRGVNVNRAINVLRSWTWDRQKGFAEWVQKHLTTSLAPNLNSVAQRLPIWLSRKGGETRYMSADDVTLLPAGIPITVGHFCRGFVTADEKVSHLSSTKLSHLQRLERLLNQFEFPGYLREGTDEAIYRDLVARLGSQIQQRRELRVPNATRVMVPANTLYEDHAVFQASFGNNSPFFLLPSFEVFSGWLPLKRWSNLDHAAFAQCAQLFQGGQGRHDADRADVLYREYTEHLPLRHPSPQRPDLWRSLDALIFIPRSTIASRSYQGQTITLPSQVLNLPPVVSPGQVVRSEFYSISWTQRAALAVQPGAADRHDRIKMIFEEFGRPTGQEVIAHLKALSRLAPGPLVLHDVKATYRWLNEPGNVRQLQSELAQLANEPVFLNIESDSVTITQWEWCAASHLAFETQELATVKPVRPFLEPYRRLLKATGVLEVFYPEVQDEAPATIESQDVALLRNIRKGFNQQRLAGQYTDVRLVPRSQDDPIDRNLLRGHRSFLSTCCSYFQGQFEPGSFIEGQVVSDPANPLDIPLDYPGVVIKAALDYCYTGVAESQAGSGTLQLEELLDLLKLSHYLELPGLLNWAQRDIIGRKLVGPDTLSDVKAQAEQLAADVLYAWCVSYEENNSEYLRQVDMASTLGD